MAEERRETYRCCDNLSRKASLETNNKAQVSRLRMNWTRVKLNAGSDTRATWLDGRCEPPQLDRDAKVDGDAKGSCIIRALANSSYLMRADPSSLICPPTRRRKTWGLGTQAVPHLLKDLAVPQESLTGQPCSAPTPFCCGSSEKGPENGKACEELCVIACTYCSTRWSWARVCAVRYC